MNPLANLYETKDAVRTFESFFAQEMTSVSEELRKASQEVPGASLVKSFFCWPFDLLHAEAHVE